MNNGDGVGWLWIWIGAVVVSIIGILIMKYVFGI